MALTEIEKVAGRMFRDQAQARLTAVNEKDPATYDVPFFIALFRHRCPGNNGKSMAIDLKEQYLQSPIYPEQDVPAGRFGYIYREGRCRACGQTARSRSGRIVDGWERPPVSGRVARS